MTDSPASANLGPPLEFLRVLWALHHQLARMSKALESRLGVTGPQRLVVRLLGRRPNITPGTLAKLMHVHPSTLTGILRRLERRNLLHRRVDRLDSRRSILALTAEGSLLDIDTAGTPEAIVQAELAGMPADTSLALRQHLIDLAEAMSNRIPHVSPASSRKRTKLRGSTKKSSSSDKPTNG